MKPLVNYCRWQEAKLRLRGRSESAVWGQLVTVDEHGNEEQQDFHFDLHSWQLTLQQEDGERLLELDEMGVPQQERP